MRRVWLHAATRRLGCAGGGALSRRRLGAGAGCCCCYSVSTGQNMVSPGCGCSKALVEEIAGELQDRKVKRGNIAQVRRRPLPLAVTDLEGRTLRSMRVEWVRKPFKRFNSVGTKDWIAECGRGSALAKSWARGSSSWSSTRDG